MPSNDPATSRAPRRPTGPAFTVHDHMITLAEDVLLLLLDERSGRTVLPTWFIPECVLTGALLAELALLGRVEPSQSPGPGVPVRVRVRDTTPTGDRLLDQLLNRLARKQVEA